jgi:hypothetical protein
MQKILLLILGIYILYYAGNIIYDLFFDNVKVVDNQDDGQLVNMGGDHEEDHAEDTAVKQISTESVGHVELPNSADFNEDDLYAEDEAPTNYNADAVRKDYEEEQQLERYGFSEEQERQTLEQERLALEKENQEKKQIADNILASIKIPKENIISSTVKVLADVWDDNNFDQFMETAKAHVVLVSNDQGHKTYKTTLSA